MGLSGSFPIDLVLFGMIAAFLILRLRSILGQRTGFERPAAPAQPNPRDMGPQAAPQAGPSGADDGLGQVVASAQGRFGPALTAMKAIDPRFDLGGFLVGAERACQMIVSGFAAGDRARLAPLLGDDIRQAFDQAITARETAGESQTTEIRSVRSITVETVELAGDLATVTVRIVSDQINITRNRAGDPVAGSESVTEVIDLWSFERALSQPDPTWRLVAARSG